MADETRWLCPAERALSQALPPPELVSHVTELVEVLVDARDDGEAALIALTAGDLDLARAHLAALDLDYARELRRSKLASVAGSVRTAAAVSELRAKRGSILAKRAIFEHDRFTCRVCRLRTIDLDVLKALSG